ncbi:MAG TPA: HK97 family phage prohead protease [Thermoleophilaceae bacterium]
MEAVAVKRPQAGEVEERQAPALEVEGRKIRGRIPYGTESRDMGGWKEIIERGALNRAELDDLVVTVDHVGLPLGRYPGTLEVEDRDDGLHWSVDPPKSREDIREAVERGDLRAGSWRMVVGKDEWRGDTRHVLEIKQLRDVSVVTRPAYPTAEVEFRSAEATRKAHAEVEETQTEERTEEVRVESNPAGSLRVEERTEVPQLKGLMEEYRSRGFPSETASLSWDEFRTVTWSASTAALSVNRINGVDLGADRRYAWQAVPNVSVDAGVTSVDVFQQTSRSLAGTANVIRAIDATSNKPETGSTLTITNVPLKQVATVESGIPNVYLEQDALATVVENDLRLAVNDGLDELVRAGLATSGFQAPGTDNILVSVRKAMTTIFANGYRPDTLLLTPANAETIDTMVSGISGGTADFVFGPGRFAPGTLFGLNVVVSKVLAAAVVLDSTANGKLYVSPITLARFEEAAGKTNTSLVRLGGHAAYGVERTGAAVRIAAS